MHKNNKRQGNKIKTPLEKEKIFQKNILKATAFIIDTCNHFIDDPKGCDSCPFRSYIESGYLCIFEIGLPPSEWQLRQPKKNEITPKLVETIDQEYEMYNTDYLPI